MSRLPVAVWLERIPPPWRWSLGVWLAGRLILGGWGALLDRLGWVHGEIGANFTQGILPVITGPAGALLGIWQRFDVFYYQRILESGYTRADDSAFFPLFPLAGRVVSLLTGLGSLASLVLVSNLALLVAFWLLYQFASSSQPAGALAALALFPTAFFLFAPYPQALALCLILLTVHLAQRAAWPWALLSGLAAGLAHSTTLPLSIYLLILAMRTRPRVPAAWLAAAGPPTGVGLFLLWRAAAGFPPLNEVTSAVWGRVFQWPWLTVGDFFRLLQAGSLGGTAWINLTLAALTLAALLACLRELPIEQAAYCCGLWLLLCSASTAHEPFASFGRYSLLMFPLFRALARRIERPALRFPIVAAAAAGQLFLSGLYFLWGWVG